MYPWIRYYVNSIYSNISIHFTFPHLTICVLVLLITELINKLGHVNTLYVNIPTNSLIIHHLTYPITYRSLAFCFLSGVASSSASFHNKGGNNGGEDSTEDDDQNQKHSHRTSAKTRGSSHVPTAPSSLLHRQRRDPVRAFNVCYRNLHRVPKSILRIVHDGTSVALLSILPTDIPC